MKLTKLSPLIPFLSLLVLFVIMVRQVLLHCGSYYDLGIYTEALRYLDLSHLNPFIPGRNIHIFNDHFDPILIPISFFKALLHPTFLGMLVDFIAIAACWWPIRMLRDSGKTSPKLAIFSYAFLILNQATIDAVLTPFHPTTWAFFPLVCVFTFYVLENFKAMFFSLVLLFMCREEFPLVGVMLGVILLFDRKIRDGVLVLILSLSWLGFAFGIRPHYFEGEYASYGSTLLTNFFTNPLQVIKGYFTFGIVKMIFARSLPLFLLLRFRSLQAHWKFILKILFIGSPILAIRFVSGQWGFHYGTAAVIVFYFACLQPLSESNARPRNFKLAYLFLAVVFVSPVLKKTKDLFFNTESLHEIKSRCPLNATREDEIDKAQEWIAKSGKQKILVQNHLAVTQILASDRMSTSHQSIYIVGGLTSAGTGPFDIVMVEKPFWGDPWPVGYERIKDLIETWKHDPSLHVEIDNEYVFLASGAITLDR